MYLLQLVILFYSNIFFSIDVNSWLVTFGFHLHNTIPGYPVPKFDLSMPSYELRKSQRWDDLPVRKINVSSTMYTPQKNNHYMLPISRKFLKEEGTTTKQYLFSLFFSIFF